MKTRIRAVVDVAFNNNVEKMAELSCSKTIDIQFGIYRAEPFAGWLTVNFKPTNGWRDWLINLLCWSNGGLHHGYSVEWDACRDKVLGFLDQEWASDAAAKGVIVSGRSKGAAEALISALSFYKLLLFRLGRNHAKVVVGAIEAPKVMSADWAEYVEGNIGPDNVFSLTYRNDIVPRFFPWFTEAGIGVQLGSRTHGLSVKDHIRSTTEEELIYQELEAL